MKTSLKEKLRRYAPPGIDVDQELKWLGFGGLFSFLYSLSFLIAYIDSYQSLFLFDGVSKELDVTAKMPDFVEVIGSSLAGFLILAFCMAAIIVYHYAYHYQGSKSIYLMKRLPDRMELHRRCITLPMLAVIACLCAAFLLLLIYFAIYMSSTPRICLTPHQWQKIWNVWLGV